MAAAFQRSLQLGLLAGRVAWLKCRPFARRADLHRRISDQLGLLHGLPQKIGQLLAFSDLDAGNSAYTALTENTATLSPNDAIAAIEQELARCPIADGVSFRTDRIIKGLAFREIDPAGISASIGQVHRAVLTDGRVVAVKVQYPGIADHLATDLRALGWLMSPVGNLRRGFDLQAYREEIGLMLAAELDYHREAGWIKRFAAATLDWPDITIPKVIDELSGSRLLTMTWLEGARLNEVRNWPQADRVRIARTLLRLFLRGCFEWGFLHADPHPGNYRFIRNREGEVGVGLLDFGCVKELDGPLVDGLRGLIADARQGLTNEERVWHWHERMGFDLQLLSPLRNLLPALAALIVEPFVISGPYDLRGWRLRERSAGLLGEHRLAYRLAGPPGMIYLLRSFQGLLHYVQHLDVPLNWWQEAQFWLDHSVPAPVKRMEETADNPGTVAASSLHIEVLEGDDRKVRLEFGAVAVDHLPELVPAELKPRLERRGLDLALIARQARESDYAAGELFALAEGRKRIRVWLA